MLSGFQKCGSEFRHFRSESHGVPAQVMRLGDIGTKAELGMEKAEQKQALEQRLPLHRMGGTGGGAA